MSTGKSQPRLPTEMTSAITAHRLEEPFQALLSRLHPDLSRFKRVFKRTEPEKRDPSKSNQPRILTDEEVEENCFRWLGFSEPMSPWYPVIKQSFDSTAIHSRVQAYWSALVQMANTSSSTRTEARKTLDQHIKSLDKVLQAFESEKQNHTTQTVCSFQCVDCELHMARQCATPIILEKLRTMTRLMEMLWDGSEKQDDVGKVMLTLETPHRSAHYGYV